MTAPLTPPHQPSSDDSWQKPRKGFSAGGLFRLPQDGELRKELLHAAVVALLTVVAGIALGLLWLWLAPRVPLVSDDTAVFLNDSEGEEAIGADGTFALLALAFGAVSAALVLLYQRRGGIALVVGLAVGGLLASVLAWRLGVFFGPDQDVVAHARAVGKGVVFDAPLDLHAKGALLAWPLAAMIVHLALTAMFGPRDPEPDWGAYEGAGAGAGGFGGPGSGTPGGSWGTGAGAGPVDGGPGAPSGEPGEPGASRFSGGTGPVAGA